MAPVSKRRAERLLFGLLATLPIAAVPAIACDDTPATPTFDAGSPGLDGASSSFPRDAQPLEGGGDDAAPEASFRVAQLSRALGAVDVCVAPHGTTTFAGPLLAATVDGGGPSLAFGQVSAYLAVDPGAYDLRLVAAGANCDGTFAAADDDAGGDADVDADADAGSPSAEAGAGVLFDATSLPPLAAGAPTTLLVYGDRASGPKVAALADDAVLAGGEASLRAVNALTALPLDFGLGSFESIWQPLLTGVALGGASAQAAPGAGAVDANGYLPIAPLDARTVSARLSAGAASDVVVAAAASIPLGGVATIFAVAGDEGSAAPALLVCIDNQPSGGVLADCSVAP